MLPQSLLGWRCKGTDEGISSPGNLTQLPHILKQFSDALAQVIKSIVNASLLRGEVLPNLKETRVTPLLKELGLELIYTNYWPVFSLSFLTNSLGGH